MAGKEKKQRRFKLPRKTLLAASGVIVLLLTASAAATYVLGGTDFLLGRSAEVYGVECRLIDTVAFDHGGERWVRRFVAVGQTSPAGRLRTAVRVAESTAESERADLVLVVAVDRNGPASRVLMRDHAVGARVVYAPHPARVANVDVPFSASYVDADPTPEGGFYGKVEAPAPAELDAMAARMKKPYGCATPKSPEKAKESHGTEKKPAHGHAAAHGHGG